MSRCVQTFDWYCRCDSVCVYDGVSQGEDSVGASMCKERSVLTERRQGQWGHLQAVMIRAGGRRVGVCTDSPSQCVFSLEAPCFTKLSELLIFTLLWLSNAPLSRSLIEERSFTGTPWFFKHHSPSGVQQRQSLRQHKPGRRGEPPTAAVEVGRLNTP